MLKSIDPKDLDKSIDPKDLKDLNYRVDELITNLKEKRSEISACVSFLSFLIEKYQSNLESAKAEPTEKNLFSNLKSLVNIAYGSYEPEDLLPQMRKLKGFLQKLGHGGNFIDYIITAEIPERKGTNTPEKEGNFSFTWLLQNHGTLVEMLFAESSEKDSYSYSRFIKNCFNYDKFDKVKLIPEIKKLYNSLQENEKELPKVADKTPRDKTKEFVIEREGGTKGFGTSMERKRNAEDALQSLAGIGFQYPIQIKNLFHEINRKLDSIQQAYSPLSDDLKKLIININLIVKELKRTTNAQNALTKDKTEPGDITTMRVMEKRGKARAEDAFASAKNSKSSSIKDEPKPIISVNNNPQNAITTDATGIPKAAALSKSANSSNPSSSEKERKERNERRLRAAAGNWEDAPEAGKKVLRGRVNAADVNSGDNSNPSAKDDKTKQTISTDTNSPSNMTPKEKKNVARERRKGWPEKEDPRKRESPTNTRASKAALFQEAKPKRGLNKKGEGVNPGKSEAADSSVKPSCRNK